MSQRSESEASKLSEKVSLSGPVASVDGVDTDRNVQFASAPQSPQMLRTKHPDGVPTAETPVSGSRRHKADPNRRRATFGVPYPETEVVLERTSDVSGKLPNRGENGRRYVDGLRLFLAVPDIVVQHSDFRECKFHRRAEGGESRMTAITFTDCTFQKSFFGGTSYRHVRFVKCSFERCDFGTAQFVDCQFESCVFQNCTGEHLSFCATEINPPSLLSGFTVPHYNYGPDYTGHTSPEDLEREWREVRRALAAQLLKSNSEIHHSDFSDAALFELKTADLTVRTDRLKSRSLRDGLGQLVGESISCATSWLILVGTRGGTSMSRLVLIAAVLIPTYALLLSLSEVHFQGKTCAFGALSISFIVEQIARACSLFLAIGYTSFDGKNATETALLTLGAAVGLIWYALLAAVVIRRVYR